MPGIMWYFALALFFLLVVILSVPSDGAPLASNGAFLVSPSELRITP